MRCVPLGGTGLQVSALCFGTLTMGPLQRNLSVAEGARLLCHAFESGVNFLDTAEIYGNYAHIGAALREYPDTVVATKCYAYDTQTAAASFESAVRGLGRDYIDIFMLHEQESAHTLRGHAEALTYFQKRKEQGLIGALGVSTHHVACAKAAREHAELEVVHPLINVRGLGIADGTRDEMLAQIEGLHAQGKGIYAMKPLGGGHFTRSARSAFDYLLGLDCIDSIAVGMQSMEEIDYNIAYFSGQTVDPMVEEKLAAVRRELLIHDWCEGCGACVGACKSGALSVVDGKAAVDKTKCVLCGYCAPKCPQFCIKVI